MHRAHVVGSLVRPPELVTARSRRLAGSLDEATYAEIEAEAIRQAVALQVREGIPEPTDGEQGRFFFGSPLCEGISGIGLGRGWAVEFHDDDGEIDEIASMFVVRDRLRLETSPVVEAFRTARDAHAGTVKVTLPGPYLLAYYWEPGRTSSIYPDPFDLFADGVAILRRLIEQLVAAGCRSIQIDQPELTLLGTESEYAQRFAERSGLPSDTMLGAAPELLNAVVDGFPQVTFGLHVCHGNHVGRWFAWGDYHVLARKVFSRLRGYDRLLLEFGVERAGDYAPLASLPGDQQVVLGLVSVTSSSVEHPGAVRAEVEAAARHYDRDLLGLSTSCGFASALHSRGLDARMQAAKLRALVRAARTIWP